MPPRVTLPPTDADTRRIRWSRAWSYVLVLLAAAAFSMRPVLFGDPQEQPWHALLHVWRIVIGVVLLVAAVLVQVVVGLRWRRRITAAGDDS